LPSGLLGGGGPTEAEKASGAAELREAAGDRGDLLAEVAGLAVGSAKNRGAQYEARGQAVAELCRMAGADEALIPQWIEGGPPPGRGRQAAAIQPTGSSTTQTLSASGLASWWRRRRVDRIGDYLVLSATPDR